MKIQCSREEIGGRWIKIDNNGTWWHAEERVLMSRWARPRPADPHLGNGLKSMEPRGTKGISSSVWRVNQPGVCRADAECVAPYPSARRFGSQESAGTLQRSPQMSSTATEVCDPSRRNKLTNNGYEQLQPFVRFPRPATTTHAAPISHIYWEQSKIFSWIWMRQI